LKPTLVVLAAGMGSRYGGLKQIDPVGPGGEVIMDYSMYDAVDAGFGKIVFVIRRDIEDSFKEKFSSKLEGVIETAYVYQELGLFVDGFEIPANREKPWGTGHAILVAKDEVNEPFAVINADDYYGPGSYRQMKDFLVSGNDNYAMVGFTLRNTLSEHGHVSRGVCGCDENMLLQKVTEITEITKAGDGAVFVDENGDKNELAGDEIVSMNLWGFGPDIFEHLQSQFKEFLAEQGNELKSEFYIPAVVDKLISSGQKKVDVLHSQERWFGVTYKEDKDFAKARIEELIAKGVYPKKLW